jgi:outer membrane protein TolC
MISIARTWRSRTAAGTGFLLAAGLLATGCHGVAPRSETEAREDLKAVGGAYRPADGRPPLPQLATNSPLGDFLRYAMLNQPQVEAAWYDWAASVERITRERSLPDPQLTFQADIANVISSIMPGLMESFPGPGKLRAAGDAASAESRVKYRDFETSVLQSAFAVKSAYYDLYFLDARLRINRQTLDLLADIEKLARSQNEVGKATLQDVLRAQIEQDRTATDLTNLADSRGRLMARFKATLGIEYGQPDPPVPQTFESTPLDLTSDRLFSEALARNPRLRGMEAEVRSAEAAFGVVYQERVPDFSAGVEADVKAAPVFYRPSLAMSLPVWKDKLTADLAAAQAAKRAAQARLSAEQIALAVEFAEQTFLYRESSRNLEVAEQQLLPKARLSLDVARTAYLSGQQEFVNLIDAERALLDIELSEVDARVQREQALAELSLLILGQPPAGAPVLGRAAQNQSHPADGTSH